MTFSATDPKTELTSPEWFSALNRSADAPSGIVKTSAGMRKRLKIAAAAFRRELKVYQLVRQDPRTPKMAKVLLGVAVAYAISPIDIIPDFIPVIGHLDDAVIIPLLTFAALRSIPGDVVTECRAIAEREASAPV
jgi:uncharacterized membrane protein YkvA (DUF1232 family)